MKAVTLISLLLLVLLTACKKEDTGDPFPPHTEVGENTFYFRVNGTLYESEVGHISSFPRIRVFYNHIDTFLNNHYRFEIRGNKVILEHNKGVGIIVNSMPNKGVYSLSDRELYGTGSYAFYSDVKPVEKYFYTNNDYTGELNITKLDTVNHIISGKFRFRAKGWLHNQESNQVVTVDGQFDVKYKPNIGVSYY